MSRTKVRTLVATTLAVAVGCLGIVASGCGKKTASLPASALGSYTYVTHVAAADYRLHKYVSRLWLEGDGTWTTNMPSIYPDGTTTPWYWYGTYTVDGDRVRLNTSDGPLFTGVFKGDKLFLEGAQVTFVKDSSDHPLPSPLPSNPPGPSPGPLIAHLSGPLDQGSVKVNDRTWTFPLTAGEEVALYYTASLMGPAHKSRISMYLVAEDGQVNRLLVTSAASSNYNWQVTRFQCTHTGDYHIKVTGYNVSYDLELQ